MVVYCTSVTTVLAIEWYRRLSRGGYHGNACMFCYCRHLSDCVCVGTADGKLVCFELTEG